MEQNFKDSKWKDKAEVNKQNRRSSDGPLHTCGSIPTTGHFKRLVSKDWFKLIIILIYLFYTNWLKHDSNLLGGVSKTFQPGSYCLVPLIICHALINIIKKKEKIIYIKLEGLGRYLKNKKIKKEKRPAKETKIREVTMIPIKAVRRPCERVSHLTKLLLSSPRQGA